VPATLMPLTVFVTAYDQYALAAFAASALDYLLKPVEDARLDQSLVRAREQLARRAASDQCEQLLKLIATLPNVPPLSLADTADAVRHTSDKLAIKDGQRIVRVDIEAIQWIDAAGDYMCIHVNHKTHVMRVTMKQLEALLDPALFLRVHRSTLINAQHVVRLTAHDNGEFFVTLTQGARLKVSRGYRDKVERFL
jgi:two-component system LytT family response regulator